MFDIVSIILAIVISALPSAVIIWIVSKLNLGLEVSGFGAALISAIIISVVSGLVNGLLNALGITVGAGILGGIGYLIVAAIVLMISGRIVPGMKVNGFTGALVAAVGIGVVGWLLSLLIGAIDQWDILSTVSVMLAIVVSALPSAVIIWIVSKLNLGMQVSGFGAALISAMAISVFGGLVNWLLHALGITIGAGILGGIGHLIVAAIVLMISGRFVPGMTVKGFTGALVAAVGIGVVGWLLSLLIGTIAV